MPEFEKGDIIGQRFYITEFLGEGTFGSVYLAYDSQWQDFIALKTFRGVYNSNPEIREKIFREANLLIDLGHHPYLVDIYFIEFLSGRLYIGMQSIGSGESKSNTLEKYLEKNKIDLPQILRWAIQFCIGIIYAYSKGVKCHGDIKPSNILIGQDNNIKISDFGQATFTDDYLQKYYSNPIFKEGYTIVTENTHNPQKNSNNLIDYYLRHDISSFGKVLYQMLTGIQPCSITSNYDGDDDGGIIQMDISFEGVDSPLSPIISRCLTNDLEQRYHRFEEIQSDLEVLLKKLTGESIILQDQPEEKKIDLNNLGCIFTNLGRYEEAIDIFNQELLINPNSAKAWSNKGRCLLKLNRNLEAAACSDKALEINPKSEYALNNKALCLAKQGKIEESLKYCDKIVELYPNDAIAWNGKGRCLIELQRYSEAIICFDKSIILDPGNSDPIKNKSICLRLMGQFERAPLENEKASEINPLDASLWNSKGNCFAEKKNYQDAISCYDRALEINPQHLNSLTNKGLCLMKMGLEKEAISYFDKGLEIDQKNPILLRNKGLCLARIGDLEGSMKSFGDALDIDPLQSIEWKNQGDRFTQLNRHLEAIAHYSKAIEIDPTIAAYHNNRGISFYRLGKILDAIDCYDKTLEIDPDYVFAWFNKGNCLMELERYSDAIICFDKVFEIDPSFEDIMHYKRICQENLKIE